MTQCPPPIRLCRDDEKNLERAAVRISVKELRALQELADRYGARWRTVLLTAHVDGTLDSTLRNFMKRPDAGHEIARAVIVPRSLPPVAGWYGPMFS